VRLLLDTHTLIWAALDDSRLSERARSVLLERQNSLFLSAASAWEIVIKYQAAKLRLPDAPERFLRRCLHLLTVETLPVTFEHAVRVETLPGHHRDPFDRILIAQAQCESLPILTRNDAFSRYAVETLW
jgi:PIN domain nuclease of toxin-antitoxin system